MAMAIDWFTKVITIPQTDLTLVGGTLYEHDTEAFYLELKALEASEEGMPFFIAHDHNPPYSVAGITYARKFELIDNYSITYENGAYTVRLAGSNNNLFDVENGILNQNNVSVIGQNAAGLIVVSGSVGDATQAKQNTIIAYVDSLESTLSDIVNDLDFLLKVVKNLKEVKKVSTSWYLIIYDDGEGSGGIEILRKKLTDKDGSDITDLEAGVLAMELENSV